MTRFYKMTGSGNDFVFFDARRGLPSTYTSADRISALCARGTGVGADGIVLVESAADADLGIRYFNRDGSLASLCGNATLCAVRLASELGIAGSAGGDLRIRTDAGVLRGRMTGRVAEFDLGVIECITPTAAVTLAPGEERVGFAVAGVPHIVVLVPNVDDVDIAGRGRLLRFHEWARPAGANVNFVSPVAPQARDDQEWRMRTYERGVETETLACGTGAVAAAAVLIAWHGPRNAPVRLWTQSGSPLDVTIRQSGTAQMGTLRGEGRLVFRGELADG